MKERSIQKKILLALSTQFQGRGIFWTNDTGTAKSMDGKRVIRFGLPGSPDIIGCLDGMFIGIEVKTATGSQQKNQKAFEKAIKSVGGFYAVARSPAEAVSVLMEAFG